VSAITTLWHTLQTADSAFPVGGFSHSYGLEGMVQDEIIRDKDDLQSFLDRTWVPLMTHLELPLVRHAYSADSRETWFELDQMAWANRATHEAREAQRQMGMQRLKLVSKMTNDRELIALAELADRGAWHSQWPVVAGIEGRVLHVSLELALPAFCYQSVCGIMAASAKLIRIGPTDIQLIIRETMNRSEKAIQDSAQISRDEIGWFTPLLDITGSRHETAYTRIFIS